MTILRPLLLTLAAGTVLAACQTTQTSPYMMGRTGNEITMCKPTQEVTGDTLSIVNEQCNTGRNAPGGPGVAMESASKPDCEMRGGLKGYTTTFSCGG